MFEIEKHFSFEAGHVLEAHDGKCAFPHGHSYQLTVVVRSERVQGAGPSQGMVCDFQEISSLVEPMIEEYFDHRWLNETLHTDSSTAEVIAQWVFEYLRPKLPGLYKVTVAETATARASYFVAGPLLE
jgi:6-pyruvoyltetrahydropterin/6-carboxytetrahydropterin synthase